ncbi:hypothetical protein M747DRAFT_22231 [Aspergillus niger ATCC 13496]|uniref:Ig-like domain-containing protein n=1 Tax=Aspergillus niger ATCC 13496 TaxID=1353008 RepID=A0A370C4X6_ASPNG|nr:hypothetical protein M747DRAFT_22231 [Aspergillus niger ATCC 13496]
MGLQATTTTILTLVYCVRCCQSFVSLHALVPIWPSLSTTPLHSKVSSQQIHRLVRGGVFFSLALPDRGHSPSPLVCHLSVWREPEFSIAWYLRQTPQLTRVRVSWLFLVFSPPGSC